jgi:hypothetical protein
LNCHLVDEESAESSEVKSSELRDDVWVTTALLDDSQWSNYQTE